jgi:cytidylate kinase
MYRAVALAAIRRGHDWSQSQQLVVLAGSLRIELDNPRVLLDGEDVSQAVRTMEVTSLTHYAADNPGVRELMVLQQREMARDKNVVTEGRDQGTVVFPDAQCKVFLTASAEERARRRLGDLAARGQAATLSEVLDKQNERDRRDAVRSCGALKKADDAIEVNTDGLSPSDVVDKLEALVRARMRHAP